MRHRLRASRERLADFVVADLFDHVLHSLFEIADERRDKLEIAEPNEHEPQVEGRHFPTSVTSSVALRRSVIPSH